VEKFATDYRYDYLDNPEEYLWGDMLDVVHIAYVKIRRLPRALSQGTRRESDRRSRRSYLCSERAAAEIKARIPDAKIIITLRNPIDRAFSHYQMDLKLGCRRPPSLFSTVPRSHVILESTTGCTNRG